MYGLDRTGQRIVGVLIEKELSVPDSYPLSENALVDGCNQKSNREPVMALETFQIAGALMALQQDEWVARVEGGGRVAKFKHRLRERLQVGNHELAVFAELLVRGPQAPGALKPRVARMGYHAEPAAIEALLQQLAARKPALVEQLPLAPRERDRRWRHRLGDGSEHEAAPSAVLPSPPLPSPALAVPPPAAPRVAAPTFAGASSSAPELAARVAALEAVAAALRAEVVGLRALHKGG